MLSMATSALVATDLLRIKARDDGFLVDSLGRVRIFHGFNDIRAPATNARPSG